MEKQKDARHPITIATVFLWIGFICAISFMEAWLKFRAPGITLPLGLGIGKLVFQALNKVELVFGITIIGSMFYYGIDSFKSKYLLFIIPFVLLIVQSLWLLPHLNARAEMIIQGEVVPASGLHLYYVIFEAAKVISLFIFGIKLLKD